jgi:hypothetical protein
MGAATLHNLTITATSVTGGGPYEIQHRFFFAFIIIVSLI